MTLKLAIVGRPNVGKSTLFNRLSRKKLAIVDDRPGVTRDWRESEGWIGGRKITLFDTAGLEDRFDGSMESRMRQQTERAIAQADVVLFVIDGREGVTPMDEHFARWLRGIKKPIILAVNKCDHEAVALSGTGEAYALGLGEPVAISSAHGFGLEDLVLALEPYFPPEEEEDGDEDGGVDLSGVALDEVEGQMDFDLAAHMDLAEGKPIKLAIVGRPNVGKSTLMNALLGEERVMTGPEAGITRDAIAASWTWEGQDFRLVDTAGLRRRARIVDPLEKMSAEDSLRAIRLAHVVVLVVDATLGIDNQDLHLARHIVDEGRVLIIALNKWDLIEDRQKTLQDLREVLDRSLGQLPGVPLVTLSAQNRSNLKGLMKSVIDHFKGWTHRVSTAALNRWLSAAISKHPPPLVQGRPNHLRYITQINIKPPTFAVWMSRPEELPDSYRRYIVNGLREAYDIPPVPVRLLLRKSKNPYAG